MYMQRFEPVAIRIGSSAALLLIDIHITFWSSSYCCWHAFLIDISFFRFLLFNFLQQILRGGVLFLRFLNCGSLHQILGYSKMPNFCRPNQNRLKESWNWPALLGVSHSQFLSLFTPLPSNSSSLKLFLCFMWCNDIEKTTNHLLFVKKIIQLWFSWRGPCI